MTKGFSARSAALMLAAVLAACSASTSPVADAASEKSLNAQLDETLLLVHDPAIIRVGDTYHLFSTGHAGEKAGIIPWRTSKDLVHWTEEGPVFAQLPTWATERIKGTRGLWAPDISYSNGEYRLYYSVSTFGKNRSAIGLAVTPTLDRSDPKFGWIDRGLVIESHPSDDYNTIDPNLFHDDDGRQWMVFGSFWGGIKLTEIDPATGKLKDPKAPLQALARRPLDPDPVEAPFLIKRDGFYYLFISYDFCCRGTKSTYYTVVGRAKAIQGPYLDRDGKPLLEGGGTVVLHASQDPQKRWVGPGHNAILRDPGQDYIVYHAYDATRRGAPALRIQPLVWTKDGWPEAR